MYHVVALGELLIDFSQADITKQDNFIFQANPGGAPCNVLAMLTKLQKKTAFIGKVGTDMFGHFLQDTIRELGIDTAGLIMSDEYNTTLAFVKNKKDGERTFSFYRNPGADMMLSEDELYLDLIKDSEIFHFGTLSMTHPGVRAATKKAVNFAKENGTIISFDPNLRPPLWQDLSLAREQMEYGCSKCDILKIEDEELKFLTSCDSVEAGIIRLKNEYNIKIIFVTFGAKGSRVCYKDKIVEKPAFITSKTIDTTGAGDTFFGCCLNFILDHGIDNLSETQLGDMIEFANVAASLVTTRKGALCSMPDYEEILNAKNDCRQHKTCMGLPL